MQAFNSVIDKPVHLTVALIALTLSAAAFCAEGRASEEGDTASGDPRHYIELAWQSSGGVYKLLRRAQARTQVPGSDPIVVLLHGVDIEMFARHNYTQFKSIVDLARQLDAEGRIELQACRLALHRKFDRIDQIDSAIELVPYVPRAIEELRAKGYRPLDR